MHEHLPIGCQSHDSIVEIRNKLEINYLRRRGSSSHAARSGGKPGAGEQTSWCWWIQPCKLVFLVGPLSFYNRSWCVKYYASPWEIWHEGWSDSRWHACLVFYQSALSQPTSFLPLLQLTPWPASAPLLKYSNTNGFWQPAIMRNNRPVSPSHAGKIWGAGARSSSPAPSLSGLDSWQLQILDRRSGESGRDLAAGERGLGGCANMSRW